MEKVMYTTYLKKYKCNYYITESFKNFSDSDNEDKINSYGVRVDLLSINNMIKDTVNLTNIGINENDVKEYIKSLYYNEITPKHLKKLIIHD